MPHDNAAIDATGMFIPIRAHFKRKAWDGFGVFAYMAWSLLLVLGMMSTWKGFERAGRAKKAPRFFLLVDLSIMPYGASGDKCRWLEYTTI